MSSGRISTDHAYARYLEHARKQQATARSLVGHVLPCIDDKYSIRLLDVGAGNGHHAAAIMEAARKRGRAVQATLIEPNLNLSQGLARRFADDKDITLVRRKWKETPFWSAPKFDIVLGANIAYHFGDQRALLKSLWAAVSPDGMLCCTAAMANTLQHPAFTELLPRILSTGKARRTFSRHGKAACIEEITMAAFNLGIPAKLVEVPADLRLPAMVVRRGLVALTGAATAAADPFCLCISFALRLTIESVSQAAPIIRKFAVDHDWVTNGLRLQANEGQLMSIKMGRRSDRYSNIFAGGDSR